MKGKFSRFFSENGWLIGFSALVLLTCISLIRTDILNNNKPIANATEGVGKMKTASPTESNTFAASSLISYYECDVIKADSVLKGKWIFVKGKVVEIGKVSGTAYVSLNSGDGVDTRVVMCCFNDPSKLTELNKGRPIIIRGNCQGYSSNVLLKNCTLFEAKASN